MLAQGKRLALDHEYRAVVGQFLRYESCLVPFAQLSNFVLKVEQHTQAYLQHPALLAGSKLAHRRLADLYLVLDYGRNIQQEGLQAVTDQGQKQDQAEYPVKLWSIEVKHKNTLWDNLLDEASAVDSGVGGLDD
jgi:hypothetical protein